jgi:hypothetical protein
MPPTFSFLPEQRDVKRGGLAGGRTTSHPHCRCRPALDDRHVSRRSRADDVEPIGSPPDLASPEKAVPALRHTPRRSSSAARSDQARSTA